MDVRRAGPHGWRLVRVHHAQGRVVDGCAHPRNVHGAARALRLTHERRRRILERLGRLDSLLYKVTLLPRSKVVVEALGLALLLLGCESTEEKCAALRGTATQAWAGYLAELESERDATQAVIVAAKKKLDGEITQRHEAQARLRANELHGTETSTAWYRTFLADTQARCSKDPECLELKVQMSEGEAKLADIGKRIGFVGAAHAAVNGSSEAAKTAAELVPADEDRPAFGPARAASAEASKVCAEAK